MPKVRVAQIFYPYSHSRQPTSDQSKSKHLYSVSPRIITTMGLLGNLSEGELWVLTQCGHIVETTNLTSTFTGHRPIA